MSGNAPSTTMMSGMSPMHMEMASNPVAASMICRSGPPRMRFATFLMTAESSTNMQRFMSRSLSGATPGKATGIVSDHSAIA